MKRKWQEDISHKKGDKCYRKGEKFLSDYIITGNAEVLSNAINAFSESEKYYNQSTVLTPSSKKVALAEVKQKFGEALSFEASRLEENGEYEEAIGFYRQSSQKLFQAEERYIDIYAARGLDSRAAYMAIYDVMLTLAVNHKNRANCHYQIADYSAADKWGEAAVKQFYALEKGYATYFASAEGIEKRNAVAAIKTEVERLLPEYQSKIFLEEQDTVEKAEWRRKLVGPASVVLVPTSDWSQEVNSWVASIHSSKRTKTYQHGL